MSYFVVASLKMKEQPEALDDVNRVLARIGFSTQITGSSGRSHDLPEATYVGEFNGESVAVVRTDLSNSISTALRDAGIKASIFVFVSDNSAWGVRYV